MLQSVSRECMRVQKHLESFIRQLIISTELFTPLSVLPFTQTKYIRKSGTFGNLYFTKLLEKWFKRLRTVCDNRENWDWSLENDCISLCFNIVLPFQQSQRRKVVGKKKKRKVKTIALSNRAKENGINGSLLFNYQITQTIFVDGFWLKLL